MLLSNGAVAGALMGCKFGFKNLPEDLLNFPHRKWLDRKVQQFLKTIGLIDEQPEDVPHREQKDDSTMEHSGVDDLPTSVVTSDSIVVVPDSDHVTTPPTGDDVTTVEQENIQNKEQKDDELMEHSSVYDTTAVTNDNTTVPNPATDPLSDNDPRGKKDITDPCSDVTTLPSGPADTVTDNDQIASSDQKQDS